MITSYSNLKLNERFRILNQKEIWTKRKPCNSNQWDNSSIPVFVEPTRIDINGLDYCNYTDVVDFYGYESDEIMSGNGVIRHNNELYVSLYHVLIYEYRIIELSIDGLADYDKAIKLLNEG
jgi:hypothetical protein